MKPNQQFFFDGEVPVSKSWLNRALILKSWNPDLKIETTSDADDVVHLQNALNEMSKGQNQFDAGHGGTTFRFLVNRVSRLNGKFFIKASDSLMRRPQSELSVFLKQMGVVCTTKSNGIEIESSGWHDPKKLVHVSANDSSQFLSSVFLSSVDLNFPLSIAVPLPIKSESYLNMTLDLMSKLGVCIDSEMAGEQKVFKILPHSKIQTVQLQPEVDMSSAFSLSACAVAAGTVKIRNWTKKTLQPDRRFLEVFKDAGILFSETPMTLEIHSQKSFQGVQFNIAECPDLFPVLCALFSQANSDSKLYGAPHLKLKESDRIEKTFELLTGCGISCVKLPDGLQIHPSQSQTQMSSTFEFDPADDHRMAMAAAVMKLYGHPIKILHPQVVNKSYPRFFQHVGLPIPMKRIFFGHRGVGKSALLSRHKTYFSSIPHFDLDEEISKRLGKSVSEIFSEQGEASFRKLEMQVFKELIQQDDFVIAVGGGFDVLEIPKTFERIYVRRKSDPAGRVFLNRPRLESAMGPIQEYQKRYQLREPNFLKTATWVYDLPEGEFLKAEIEKQILNPVSSQLDAYVTLYSESVKQFAKTELRTDLLTKSFILSQLNTTKNVLLSLRRTEDHAYLQIPEVQSQLMNRNLELDWALEIGKPTLEQMPSITVISSHELEIQTAISALSGFLNKHLKLCPIVNTFAELKIGHDWQMQDPSNRSFLPRTNLERTSEASWQWYRILQASRQKINFVSQFGDISDQPSIYQLLENKDKSSESFGAVLGQPILHSWTPSHHSSFFSLPVVAVPLSESRFDEGIAVLQELGLQFAAVTSPLKNLASRLTQVVGCNSIVRKNDKWIGMNTDVLAMHNLVEKYIRTQDQVAVWGGGGVLDAIAEKYPRFKFFLSRTGILKVSSDEITNPTVVIWAAPRHSDTKWPPGDWRPRLIIDLNYTDSSMGREWAQKLGIECKVNAEYISGMEFFLIQAEHQIKFFKEQMI